MRICWPLSSILFIFLAAYCSAADIGLPPNKPAAPPQSRSAAQTPRAPTVSNFLISSDRATVQSTYLNIFVPTKSVPIGFTGNVATGNAGDTAQAYKNAVVARINWLRQLAGVPTITGLNPTWNQNDQKAALMFSANGQLSHSPPSTWTYYTPEGASAAGSSNICLGFSLSDPGCVELYMQDASASNSAVGHRRWILYPQTQLMGTGDVAGSGGFSNANALWVFDTANMWGPRPPTRDTYVAWPPPGFIPYMIVPSMFWSFSYPAADFTAATISMTSAGGSIPVTLQTQAQGYGENTIVWSPQSGNLGSIPSADTSYTVTVNNVKIGGNPQNFSYTVTVFDPATGGGGGTSLTLGSVTGSLTTINQAQLLANVSGGSAPYTYSWTAPAGVALSNPSIANPTALFSATGTFHFSVVVRDSVGAVSGSVDVAVSNPGFIIFVTPPGTSLQTGVTYPFSASASNLFTGQPISPPPIYQWSITSPSNPQATINSAGQFVASAAGTYHVQAGALTNSGGVDVTVTGSGGGTPNVTLQKSASPLSVAAGETVTFSIEYQNSSSTNATNVVITDAVPTGSTLKLGTITAGGAISGNTITWNLGTVAGNGSGTVSFQVITN